MGANSEAIEAWNTVLFDKFERFREVVVTGLGRHGEGVLARYPPEPGMRVLDVGCGFGDTTITIGRLVGERGQAVGVDAAPRFIEAATREAAGAPNVRFLTADVEAGDLGGPYDRAFSRFGTMFFTSPVRALRNVRSTLAPGALMTFVVWRKREDNAWMHEAEQAVRALIGQPEKKDAVTCGPGPFSMAGADLVTDVLAAAGFREVTLTRQDIPIMIGRSVEQALEFAMALGPAGELMRLAGAEGEQRRPEVEAALRQVLAPLLTPEGVVGMSSTWVIAARA